MDEKYLPKLIGIGGRLRHGKDSVADVLVEKYGYVKIGMSDPLVEALRLLNPLVPAFTSDSQSSVVSYAQLLSDVGYTEAKKNPEVRRLLQRLATEVCRDFLDEDIWVVKAEQAIEKLWAEGKRVALTGIRYDNELGSIVEQGGTTIYVHRPSVDEGIWVPADANGSSAHTSEVSLAAEDFQVVIENSGSLEDLAEAVTEALSVLADNAQIEEEFEKSTEARTHVAEAYKETGATWDTAEQLREDPRVADLSEDVSLDKGAERRSLELWLNIAEISRRQNSIVWYEDQVSAAETTKDKTFYGERVTANTKALEQQLAWLGSEDATALAEGGLSSSISDLHAARERYGIKVDE